MLNVLIPASGRGSRFESTGQYTFPKPLIEVFGKPMLQVVVDNIGLEATYIFLVLKEHYDKYALKYLLPLITKPNVCKIVIVDTVTEGAACTALLAKDLINNDDELLIANSDQYIEWNGKDFFTDVTERKSDAALLTFEAVHPKWSYALLNGDGWVVEVAEKKPISNVASTGLYWFKRGGDFVKSAERMIEKDIRTNGEFYICPALNELIEDGGKVSTFTVRMHGLGTPEDLQAFIVAHPGGIK